MNRDAEKGDDVFMGNGLLNKIDEKVELIIGFVGLVGIIVITLNVICRFILKISMSWSDEFLRTLFIYGYFIGAALMFYSGGLMRLEILENAFKKRGMKSTGRVLDIILNLVNLVFFGMISYYVFGGIIMPFISSGVSTSTSSTPAWVLPMGYGLGILAITLLALKNIIKTIFFYKK